MTMSSKEKIDETIASHYDYVEWTSEEEVQLFLALAGLKPIGVNKHFYMVFIAERLSNSLNREIPAEAIWAHLRTMYNLDMLDEMEPLPFPNEEKEFSLPEKEFATLLSKKRTEGDEKKQSNETTNSNRPSIIAVATDNTPKEKLSTLPKTISIHAGKELDRKISAKLLELPKRNVKRTRGSSSFESNSPSTTPPPIQGNKRRRI